MRILFLNSDGSVKAQQRITESEVFRNDLRPGDNFGVSVAVIGDLDCNGVSDLAVGAEETDDGGTDRGAIWILLMESSGIPLCATKVSDTVGGFDGVLHDLDLFGVSASALGDLDADDDYDVIVGAAFDDEHGNERGAAWLLTLNGCEAPSDVDDYGLWTPPLIHSIPNPTRGRIRCEAYLAGSGPMTIRLVDPQGRIVDTITDGFSEAGSHSFEWSNDKIGSGVYHIILDTVEGRSDTRVVVVR